MTDCKTKNSRHQVGGFYKTFLMLNINPDNIHLASHVARKQVINLKLIGVMSMLASVNLDCHEFRFPISPPVFFLNLYKSTWQEKNKYRICWIFRISKSLNNRKIMTIGDASRSRNRLWNSKYGFFPSNLFHNRSTTWVLLSQNWVLPTTDKISPFTTLPIFNWQNHFYI